MSSQAVQALVAIGIDLLLGAIDHALPRLGRADLYFAVTVPSAFRDTGEGRRILARYRIELWLHVLAGAGLCVLVAALGLPAALGVLWTLLGASHAFVRARRRVLPHAAPPSREREASLAGPEPMPGGAAAPLVPLAILAVTAGALRRGFDALPARIPIHYDWAGRADAWAPRTPGSVYGLVAVGAALCALLALLALGILRGARTVHAAGEAGARERRFLRAGVAVVIAAEYLVAGLFSTIALIPLHPAIARWLPVAGAILPLAFVIAVLLALVPLARGRGAGPVPVGDRTEDARWRWGLFYADHHDPALFVEKRFGLGWTLNFGHAWAWVILGAFVAVPLLPLLLLHH